MQHAVERRPGAPPRAAPSRAAARRRRGSSSAASGSSPRRTSRTPRRSRTPGSTRARSRRRAATGGWRRWRPPTGSRARSRGSRPRRASSRRSPPKPSSCATNMRLGVEVHAGERARAERQVVGGGHAEVEALEVAAELPEVGEQVVREVDGLGALEVRVARHRPVQVRLGELHERLHQVAAAASVALEAVGAHEHRHVGGHLVVARAGGVELAAHRADDLGEPPLDRHVDVLVVRADDEAVRCSISLLHGLEAALELARGPRRR